MAEIVRLFPGTAARRSRRPEAVAETAVEHDDPDVVGHDRTQSVPACRQRKRRAKVAAHCEPPHNKVNVAKERHTEEVVSWTQ